jgi:LPS-assembly protein
MYCRFFLFFCFFLWSASRYVEAAAPVWDCKQSENGEWVCITEPKSTPPATTQQPVVQVEPETEKAESDAEQVERADLDAMPDVVPETVAPVDAAFALPAETEPAKPVDINIIPKTGPIPEQPPKIVATQPGWTCATNPEDATWDCQLVGRDPKGQARLMEDDESFRLLAPAFDLQEEQIFSTLRTELKYDPWQRCSLALGPATNYPSQKDQRSEFPLNVSADYSEVFDEEITSFWGNIDLARADQHIQADMATYDSVSEVMDLQGNIYYSDEGLSMFSETAQLKLGADQAVLRDALFISPSMPVRGNAKVIYRDSKTLSHYHDVAYTSCATGNQDWVMHASRLKMNQETGKGSVKHAWLEFMGLPVMYLPYLSFPLDDRRKSGLLAPTIGYTDEGGVDINVPYYWNIAPNYDATVWARVLTRRGGLFGGDVRYLTEWARGEVKFEVMPFDTVLQKTRWQGRFKNFSQITPRLKSTIDLNYVSDEDYFIDLGNSLRISTDRFLRSKGDITYNRPGVAFSALVENYQIIDKNLPSALQPYRQLPDIVLNLDKTWDLGFMPLQTTMANEFVFFQHDEKVQGQRFNIQPSIEIPYTTPGTFIKPKVTLQYTQYWLTNQTPGKSSNISRLLPKFSLDSGLYAEKDFQLGGMSMRHTLEPRLFYLYIPFEEQGDIPLFDTSANDFSFNQMFREERFNSVDRVQDTNQLTVALTSRLLDAEKGIERLNLSVGQIFYFQDRKVNLVPGVEDPRSFSNLIAEFKGQITDHWSFSSALQWNPQDSFIERGEASVRYRNKGNQIFNAGYRFRQTERLTTINQTNVSFLLPIYDSWSIVGRWQYSLLDDITLESYIGLEKDNCCWRFRILARRFINGTREELDTSVFVQLELKGLASIGDKVEDFLEKNLSGYRKPLKF